MIKKFSTSVSGYKVLNLSAELCKADHDWQLDGVKFEFLHLNYSENTNLNINNNDNSCILKIHTNQHSMLFTGDLSRKLEKLLVAKYSNKLKSDILLIPHHGSHSSSSEKFIVTVNPKFAVVSAGYMNMYGHPKKEVLAKYLAKNIKILNTIEHGTIDLKLKKSQLIGSHFESGTIEYNCYRISNRNFWNY